MVCYVRLDLTRIIFAIMAAQVNDWKAINYQRLNLKIFLAEDFQSTKTLITHQDDSIPNSMHT